ncbi:hypothetical protein KVH27_19455 [Streptomyces olivaceus]|uniref:hypothetical protein n=1 Tax=Streptomyces olivaceus TaxID=47716 RepID=UPI001CD02536|nr:hypothetical protein [Streptomyces olivaceus]MBZ6250545.1 hypothetical protein [Streptomyces olivaceus]
MSTLPTVWILTKGGIDVGEEIRGVFWSKDDAKADFLEAADPFAARIDGVWQDGDGALRVGAGDDFVALTPHPVQGQAPRELEAGR